MQESKKVQLLKLKVGNLIKNLRLKNDFKSLNKFALSYDINRANLSKIECGKVGCSLAMAWRISEALGMKLSDFIKLLEDELGADFKLMDE